MFENNPDEPEKSARTEPVAMPPQEMWTRTLRRLRAQLGEDVYSSWFSRLELAAIDPATLTLSAPTRFLKSWIEVHYSDRILVEMRRELPALKAVVVAIRSVGVRDSSATGLRASRPVAAKPQEPPARSRPTAALHLPPAADTGAGAAPGVDARYTFANFVVGASNALAHAAAMRTASTGKPVANCNHLYVHAGVGLGKTHLLLAIGNEAARHGRRVQYLTADAFMYGFASSVRSQNALNFKDRLRSIDVLLTDDVQFLQGKSNQQEFCHTLNALIDSGKTVVVAADRPPGELESLEERVRSRLKGGLVVDIDPHDAALRRQILAMRIAAARALHPAFEVPDDVIDHIAQRIHSNGRDLEGAVNRLLAQSSLTGVAPTVDSAEQAIRDLVGQREPRRPKIEEIQKLVANHFNVSRADILSARRTANVVKPRQVAMYLAKVLTPRSLPEIGRRFGGRDHTTVLHAVRKVGGMVEKDGDLRDTLDALKRILTD